MDTKYPVYCRVGSSDKHAFSHVFFEQEYRFLRDSGSPKVIVDCGIVGYSASFLSQFPEAHVISIEPDDRNVRLLRLNTGLMRDAVLSSTQQSGRTRQDLMSARVNIATASSGLRRSVSAVMVNRGILMRSISGLSSADSGLITLMFSMDIEGSERVVFSRNYESWVDRVGCFLIELHDEGCRDVFFQAIGREKHEIFHSGELTVARRTGPIGLSSTSVSTG